MQGQGDDSFELKKETVDLMLDLRRCVMWGRKFRYRYIIFTLNCEATIDNDKSEFIMFLYELRDSLIR